MDCSLVHMGSILSSSTALKLHDAGSKMLLVRASSAYQRILKKMLCKLFALDLVVSLLKDFMMSVSVHCILVCEPNYLLAAIESGETACMGDEHIMLHAIANCAFLVVGHDWTGSFFVWDLSRRALLAKYSASQHYVARVLPVGLYTNFKMEKIKEYIAVAEKFTEPSTTQCFNQQNSEDVAILLLVSVYPENDLGRHSGTTRWLVLLGKNRVIMDNTVNFRASAANVLGGKGIILALCTYGIYVLEEKLFNLQIEKEERMSS